MASDLPMTGGCACGAIRYECAAEPAVFLLCRCNCCRHMTGSAFAANVYFPVDSVVFTQGTPKEFIRDGESGQPLRHRFCGDCGAPVGVHADAFSEFTGVPVGSLDDSHSLKPAANVWLDSKFPWDKPDADLAGYERNMEL